MIAPLNEIIGLPFATPAIELACAAERFASASQGIDSSRLEEMIAVAAYFRAEQRGFAPGDELDDWFQAEAEYLCRADPVGKGN